MICPRCGSWIDEGEPYCPGCLWDGSDDDEEEDDYFGSSNTQIIHDSYEPTNQNYSSNSYTHNTRNSSNQHTTHTHTINNDTGEFETEKPKNSRNDTCDPFTCCCGGIIILWILGILGSLLGL